MLIAGGGTGGHLFPGIAVANELVRRVGAEVRFVGSDHGIERTAVPRAGFEVELLPVRGVMGQGLPGLLRACRVVPLSLVSAWRLIGRVDPSLVIGVGGYAAFPALGAAVLRRRPIVLLEQNAQPGFVTKLFARFAYAVCASFPETVDALGPRARLTGNPIRFSPPEEREPVATDGPLRVLVFGGSAGAHQLNTKVPGALSRLGSGVRVLHQTGARDRDQVAGRYAELGVDAQVVAFIDDMDAAYADADLAICRSGATTLAELTALGVPAVLVPYPYAAADHQRTNGQALVDAGAAWMILDADLDEDTLVDVLEEARSDRQALAERAARARELGRPEALAAVVDTCLEAARGPVEAVA